MRSLSKTPLIPIVCLSLWLSACSHTMAPMRHDRSFSQAKDAIADSITRNRNLPPNAVTDALVAPINIQLPENTLHKSRKRFDLTARKVAAQLFFPALVQDTRYNMVVHPDVKGQVSLNLKNVTVEDVISFLEDTYNYDVQRSRTGFQILPRQLQTRMFRVNYPNITREGVSSINISAGSISSGVGGDSTPTGTTINTDNVNNFWKEIDTLITQLVDKKGQVIISPQSGTVVVTAMPGILKKVENFLQQIQNSVHRQVIIEAKIIEVQLSDGVQSGINWGGMHTTSDGNSTRDAFSTPGNQSGLFNMISGNNANLLNSTLEASVTGSNPLYSMAFQHGNVAGFLEFLETQGSLQVLSSPRISALNNQKSVIKVGRDEFFVTNVKSTNSTSSTGTSQPTAEIELTPFFSGIALDVTPQISDEGNVILHIHPTISEVQDDTKTIVVNGTTQSLPLARSDIRESDTIIRARNGQMVVIGGLMREKEEKNWGGVPFIAELPYVGAAFRNTGQSKIKTELVIMLRPTIVESNQQWEEALQTSADYLTEASRQANYQKTQKKSGVIATRTVTSPKRTAKPILPNAEAALKDLLLP
jgi:MSHA biogenesis protein MshL